MGANNLVIVGNGFDLYHGVRSSFWHYKEWLIKRNHELYNQLERYIDVGGNWWNDFERNLGDFNIVIILRECPRNYKRYKDSRFPPALSYPGNSFFDEIRNKITVSFEEWVKTLAPVPNYIPIPLPEAQLYISFNYTDSLERLYGISEEHILYIHGKASCGDDLVFGHGKSHFEIERDFQQKYGLKESDSFYDAGTFGDEEYQLTLNISSLKKNPYTQIVKYDGILLPAVKDSDEVFIYGFSFSEVDFQYIDWIAEQKPNLIWHASWHTEEDKQRIEAVFKGLRIKDYHLFQL